MGGMCLHISWSLVPEVDTNVRRSLLEDRSRPQQPISKPYHVLRQPNRIWQQGLRIRTSMYGQSPASYRWLRLKHTSLYERYQTTERLSLPFSWATARAHRTFAFQPARTTPSLFGTITREIFSGHFYFRQRHFVSPSTHATERSLWDSKTVHYKSLSFSSLQPP
jgi:hypothetical protein